MAHPPSVISNRIRRRLIDAYYLDMVWCLRQHKTDFLDGYEYELSRYSILNRKKTIIPLPDPVPAEFQAGQERVKSLVATMQSWLADNDCLPRRTARWKAQSRRRKRIDALDCDKVNYNDQLGKQ